jgi:hypothetical protein
MVAHVLDGRGPWVLSNGRDVELGSRGVYSGDIGFGGRLRREGGGWMRRHSRAGQSGQARRRNDKVEERHGLGGNNMGTRWCQPVMSIAGPRTASLGGELIAAGRCAVQSEEGALSI